MKGERATGTDGGKARAPTSDVVELSEIPDGNRTLYLPDDPEDCPRQDGDFILRQGLRARASSTT